MNRRSKRIVEQEPSVNTIVKKEKLRKKLEKRNRRKAKISRLFKIVFRLTIIVLVALSVYYFDQSKYSRVRLIKVSGNQVLSDEILLEPLKIKEGDRLLTTFFKSLSLKDNVPGVAKQTLKLYYTKGQINLTVEEYPVVAQLPSDKPQYLLADNSIVSSEKSLIDAVPLLINIDEDTLKENPLFAQKLEAIDSSTRNSISEIERIDEPLEDLYFKFTMNHGYFVFTNVKSISMMDYYPDIVSGIQSGNKKDNRCIYLLDYQHTDENQSAVAKPCN